MKIEHDIERINRENFRNSLEALARPGEQQTILPLFNSGMLGMASILLYAEVTYCYQGTLNFQVIQAICGANKAPASTADYLFFDHPDADFLHHAKVGTAENPEFGATLLFSYNDNTKESTRVVLSGPGINGQRVLTLPVSEFFITCLREKNESFPMGVDTFFINESNMIMGLPRTTHIEVLS